MKNNLQTISSLLRLQGRRLSSDEAKAAVADSVRRIRTNTPLAALVTLNDPVYLECAQQMAIGVRANADDAAAVRTMVERALGRAATDVEIACLAALVANERARYAGRDEAAKILAGKAAEQSTDLARDAALVAAANAILNLDDFLTKS